MTEDNPANAPVLEERNGAIAILTLNRPEQRNCLSREMISTLHDAFGALASDTGTNVIILRAKGPAFCSGHDLREMTLMRETKDRGEAAFADLFKSCAQMMTRIQRHPKPVIAEVGGAAMAAGCQLVASCDLAVASREAVFATPGVNIGLFCSTPMVALGRNVARKHAMEMLLLGESVDALRAAELGLVNRVTPATELHGAACAIASKIADKSTIAIRYGKRAFYDQIEMDLDSAYAHTARVMALNMLAGDASEGIDAFLDKRAPDWPGN